MRSRPLSITIISWIFIVMGSVGLVYHSSGFFERRPFDLDWLIVTVIRLLAIVGGVFTLRGCNWARWLLAVWIGFHVWVGYLNSWHQFIVHGLLFLVILYFLFRRQSAPQTPHEWSWPA